jgi:hypothetical protein
MNGSSISQNGTKGIKKITIKKIENRTGSFCALHTALQWNLLFSYIKERDK